MRKESQLIKLEKEIISKLLSIKDKKVTPKDSGIGKLINLMKTLDEPLHTKLMDRYKTILKEI